MYEWNTGRRPSAGLIRGCIARVPQFPDLGRGLGLYQLLDEPPLTELIASWPCQLEDSSVRRDWGWSPQYDLEAMADDLWREFHKVDPDAPGLLAVQ